MFNFLSALFLLFKHLLILVEALGVLLDLHSGVALKYFKHLLSRAVNLTDYVLDEAAHGVAQILKIQHLFNNRWSFVRI